MRLTLGSLLLLLALAACAPAAPLPAPETLAPPPASATVAATARPGSETQASTPVEMSGTLPPQPFILPIRTKEPDMSATRVQPPSGLPSESIQWARQDLAKRLSLPVEQVAILDVTGQVFSAEAFYCRAVQDRITRDATPVPISGFSILLKAGTARYEYHAREEEVFFCRVLR